MAEFVKYISMPVVVIRSYTVYDIFNDLLVDESQIIVWVHSSI